LKERLTTLLLAGAALALFWVLFFPKPQTSAPELSKPLSQDSGSAGYLGLWRWLQGARTPIAQLRQPYKQLLQRGTLPGATGNLLIVTLPMLEPADASEFSQLETWIQRGNTVVVLAALDDTPGWAVSSGGSIVDELERLARVHMDAVSGSPTARRSLQSLLTPEHPDLMPIGRQPLFDGVKTLATSSEYAASHWLAVPVDASPLLEVARRADTREVAMWLKSEGSGRLLISAYAGLFSNERLGHADNARLFSNLVGNALAGNGRVIFDDAHQGVVDYYDPKAFYADARLHYTLLWILLLWLLFVLGAQRLRAAGDAQRPIDDTAMLETSAGFLANMLSPAAAARRLIELFFNTLRQRLAKPQDGQPLWEWLEAHARVRSTDLDELKRLYQRAYTDQRIDLMQLQSLLLQLAGCTS